MYYKKPSKDYNRDDEKVLSDGGMSFVHRIIQTRVPSNCVARLFFFFTLFYFY